MYSVVYSLKKNFKVALSGEFTTNALLFKIAYPDARIVYKNFLEIEKAVLEDEVDAGVLIHESILGFSDALTVEREIWDIWKELCKEELPLPLGGMALRRSIPLHRAILCEKALIQEYDDIFHNPAFKVVRNTASYYDEGVESGHMRVAVKNFFGKNTYSTR